MPAYNAEPWLQKTVPRIELALKNAGVQRAELIIVNDGSTDNTAEGAAELKPQYPLKVITQKNSGRFIARDTGTKAAKYDNILFIDTRVYIDSKSLKYVFERIAQDCSRRVWTAHVYLEKNGNIYARFWDAIVYIAWRKYFSNPRDYSYGIKEFDYYPKGTTCFFVPKDIISEANAWFRKHTKDLKTSNDDTLLIRHIAESHLINISPEYSCTYHARGNLRQYVKHVYHRGKVFVDGFLRRDGNRFFWPLVAFLILSVVAPTLLILNLSLLLPVIVVCVLLWLTELLVCLLLGMPAKDAWSLFILSPLFAVVYGAGIWRAYYKLHVSVLFNH